MGNGKRVYSVTQINRYIKSMFEQDFLLEHVTVSGEISGLKYHSSGHIYFNLKDDGGLIPCVMWASSAKNLKTELKEGDRVEVTGQVDVYEKQGRYQMIAGHIEGVGKGDLYAQFLALKEKLEEAGYFDETYKKPIPEFVKRLGIITAETGAAVHDIISITRRRNPFVEMVLFPARVQGEGAAESLIEGVNVLDMMGLDVIIIGRGGGSIEDLMPFNDERLAKTIFNCETPIVSAVGHETDFTIADFVADRRAPTPSAAAELCIFEYDKALREACLLRDSMLDAMNRRMDRSIQEYNMLRVTLMRHDPMSSIMMKKREAASLLGEMQRLMERRISDLSLKFAVMKEKMEALSPMNRISDGFALVVDDRGKRVTDPAELSGGDSLVLYMGRSRVDVTVERVSEY